MPSVSDQHPLPSSSPSPSPTHFSRPHSCIDSLTHDQRMTIITLYKENYSRYDIARKIPCSLNTVGHWIRRYEFNHSVEDIEREGRPRCTDEETDEKMIELAEERKFITPKQIKNELSLDCSSRTVRRRLDEVGLHGRIAQREFPFTDEIIRKRKSFAEGYLNWTIDQWDAVVFSDETHVELGTHSQVWVQRRENETFDPQFLTDRIPHPQRVSLWGCFCAKGIGQAEIFTDTLDGAQYVDILAHNLPPTYNCFYPSGQWWFLQDNAPAHCSNTSLQWLHNHGINCIDFPPNSPDLNPIENLWADVKRRVDARRPHNTQQLEQYLGEEWEATDPNFLISLAHSMPDRCKAVVLNQGHRTHY